MSLNRRFLIGFLLLSLPLLVLAAPASVTGIKADLQNGKVHVSWQPLPGNDIETYRIFFGHASILDSGGEYDDFENAPGNVSEFVLPTQPAGDQVYVSILAVNAQGEESAAFSE